MHEITVTQISFLNGTEVMDIMSSLLASFFILSLPCLKSKVALKKGAILKHHYSRSGHLDKAAAEPSQMRLLQSALLSSDTDWRLFMLPKFCMGFSTPF